MHFNLHAFLAPVVVGIASGLFTRILLLQRGYRNFPSKPHGLIIQLFLAFVASLIGSFVVPALFKPDFTAGVFVSIGTAQFHTMRGLERDAWLNIDKGEIVPRGTAYIESMAMAIEARIFLCLGISTAATLIGYLFGWPWGVVTGFCLALIVRTVKQGKSMKDLADVKTTDNISIESGKLKVNGLVVCDIPCASTVKKESLLAVEIRPKTVSALITLSHQGQQQAILHNLAIQLGVDTGNPIKPTAAYHAEVKQLIVVIAPLIVNTDLAADSVIGCPVLDNLYRHSRLDA